MDLIRDFFESKARIEISPRLVFLQRLDLCDRHSSGPKVAKTPLDQTGGDSLASLIRIDGEIDDPADARDPRNRAAHKSDHAAVHFRYK